MSLFVAGIDETHSSGGIPVMPLDFVELCVCVWHLKRPAEDAGSPGVGVTGSCEPPIVGAGN